MILVLFLGRSKQGADSVKKALGLCLIVLVVSVIVQVYAGEYMDEFDESQLKPEWTWSADARITYLLAKGYLRVDIPAGSPFDVWNRQQDGMLLLRKDQGSGDWTVETGFHIVPKGRGYQVGIVVWSNQHLMYFWGLKRDVGKNDGRPTGEFMGISDLSKIRKGLNLGTEARLRIEKNGKDLDLQYWDEDSGEFVTHQTYRFKYPVNAVGLVARTFAPKGAALQVYFDYFHLLRAEDERITTGESPAEEDEEAAAENSGLQEEAPGGEQSALPNAPQGETAN